MQQEEKSGCTKRKVTVKVYGKELALTDVALFSGSKQAATLGLEFHEIIAPALQRDARE